MTQFHLVSDLHLSFKDLELPGGEVLLMAGDIMEAGTLRRADNAKKDTFLADRFRRFIKEELSKYEKVVYICGNHEHYDNALEDTISRLRDEMPQHATMLEQESLQIGDIQIFGGTFWTSMNNNDPMVVQTVGNSMNDFESIRFAKSQHIKMAYGGSYWTNKFTPQHASAIFRETLAKLESFCETHKDDKVLVMSHHAPSQLSIDPTFKHEIYMNFGYYSELFEFIADRPCIKTWVHGHVHSFNDYNIESCRVLCNPRGYSGYETIANDFTVFQFDM